MKSSGIGGQAVLEGIMMKNGDRYAVAVRKKDQEIVVKADDYRMFTSTRKWAALPFVRGIFNFVDSMVLGMKTLTYSAGFFEDEEDGTDGGQTLSEGKEKAMIGFTVAFSIVMAVAIFMVLPVVLSNIFKRFIPSATVLSIAEGCIRLAIFIGYILLISRMEDIRRVFMYHGAEHKCINCVEHGLPLTVKNVMKSSRQHKRCGTSFLLFVMLISIILFIFIRVDTLWLRVATRILLVPVIAGISFEVLRLAGNSDSAIVNAVSKPGLWLQKLTTREPDESMAEVAIQAVEAVFDWKEYLDKNFPGWEPEL